MNLSFLKVSLRIVASVAAAWIALEAIGLFLTYGTLFPVWAMALVIGVGVNLINSFYRRERALVSKKTGRWLLAMRIFSFCLVALILMQPIFRHTVSRRIERVVAVLLDTSDSMTFTDTEWDAGERLSIAKQAKLIDGKRDIPLPSLGSFEEQLAKLSPWIESEFAEGKTPSTFRKLVNETRKTAGRIEKELNSPAIGKSTNPVFRAFSRQLTTAVIPAVKRLYDGGDVHSAIQPINDIRSLIPEVRSAVDDIAWNELDDDKRAEIIAYADTNRFTIAASILTNSLSRLSSRYALRHYELGRQLRPLPSSLAVTNSASQRAATDITAALESLLTDIPSEQLAGVLLLTDGIHNGDASVEPAARQLGGRGVHANSVLVGSKAHPFDLALADISTPESIFLGDKVRVRGTLSAGMARGKEAKISLMCDGEKVDETSFPISEDIFKREFSLSHAPTNNGLAHYELAIENIEGERFPSNNTWQVDVSVSDDRTHVLLIDDYPRWDFRYLRNLFYARDKSVHLQYLLMHPDTISGIDTTNRPPAASATRPFGEAEAGAFPENADEWRKFDVIILGDIGPDVLTWQMQTNISECVNDRGALLVTIAGPRAMPHAFPTNSPLAELLPFEYEWLDPNVQPADGRNIWEGPEKSYSVALTPSGRMHPVMQQSSSLSENEQLWKSIPKFHWRFPLLSARPGAEIIAFAEPEATGPIADVEETANAFNAAEIMEKERMRREQQAIITGHNVGRGKVLSLNTDESWRLRYRIGDTRHHRFWGQILRWGLGERLRSGTALLRIGTERMSYAPNEPVRVISRVLKEDFTPITDADIKIEVTRENTSSATNVQDVSTISLSYVEDSQGLYEAILPPMEESGAYRVRIIEPERYSGENAEHEISTTFFVATARRPVEMADVSAKRETLEAIARWTGGRVVMPHEADELVSAFGEPSRTIKEPAEIALWCKPWLFIILLLNLISEWTLRKMRGLV